MKPCKLGARLSVNEREVFDYLGQGKTTREICELKKIGRKTVHSYHLRLRQKLGAENINQLIRMAVLASTAALPDRLVMLLDATKYIEVRYLDEHEKLLHESKFLAQ
jgi:DNA-binding CsgD family transcriptional regulator